MNDRQQPIKEIVLSWLNEHGGGPFPIGSVAEETDLSRRQVTTALHSLADHGLAGSLERTGKGIWVYDPPGDSTVPQAAVARPGYSGGGATAVRGTLNREQFNEALVRGLCAALGVEFQDGFLTQWVQYDYSTDTYDVVIVQEDIFDPAKAQIDFAYTAGYLDPEHVHVMAANADYGPLPWEEPDD